MGSDNMPKALGQKDIENLLIDACIEHLCKLSIEERRKLILEMLRKNSSTHQMEGA